MIILTNIYIILELIYNNMLIEFISSKNASLDLFNNLEMFGKILFAFGMSFFAMKFASQKLKVGLTVGLSAFLLVHFGFDFAIRNLPTDYKLYAYNLGVYRNLILNDSIKDNRFDGSQEDKIRYVGFFGMNNADYTKTVNDYIFPAANYDKQLDELYTNYSKISDRYESYYSIYFINNKRYQYALEPSSNIIQQKKNEIVKREFEKRSGGIPLGLTKENFYKKLSENNPQLKEFYSKEVIKGNDLYGIKAITVGDIPLGLNKDGFKEFFNSKLSEIKNKIQANKDNIDNLPNAHKIISSVYIPIFSLVLSLISIIMNATNVLSSILGKYKYTAFLLPVGLGVVLINPVKIEQDFNQNLAIPIRAEYYVLKLTTPLQHALHNIFINDENPVNVIKVERVNQMDESKFLDIDKQMENIKEVMPELGADNITIDKSKIEDKGYFGEIKTKTNPYLNN